jgi:hypothetical protein
LSLVEYAPTMVAKYNCNYETSVLTDTANCTYNPSPYLNTVTNKCTYAGGNYQSLQRCNTVVLNALLVSGYDDRSVVWRACGIRWWSTLLVPESDAVILSVLLPGQQQYEGGKRHAKGQECHDPVERAEY